jgi:hypothetical protein
VFPKTLSLRQIACRQKQKGADAGDHNGNANDGVAEDGKKDEGSGGGKNRYGFKASGVVRGRVVASLPPEDIRLYKVGDAVEGNFRARGRWYRGEIVRDDIGEDLYNITYADDGRGLDTEVAVHASRIRLAVVADEPDGQVKKTHIDCMRTYSTYVCMRVCIYACMYFCISVCVHVFMT